MKQETKGSSASEPAVFSLEEAIEQARRAYALRQYEQAVDHYATALELHTEKYGDDTPETADLYFAYGKALLENAIAQSSVLGKDQAEAALGSDDSAGPSGAGQASAGGAFLSFDGDAEETEEDGVALFSGSNDDPNQAVADDDEDEDGEDAEDGEPEDDFNAAWEVLDLARAIFDRQKDEDDEVRLKLADTYITLGDVSLETEKFDQAITDYEMGLQLKESLLPHSSRQLAEAHYKLGLVLDLTSGRLADAIVHVRRALECTDARLDELRAAGSGESKADVQIAVSNGDTKGKGKAGAKLIRDPVSAMTPTQIASEMKELEEVREDLKLKMEELASPNDQALIPESAPALAARALDRELNGPSAGSTSLLATIANGSAPVNDLTGMVKKKKKPVVTTNGAEPNGTDASGKRKAEEEPVGSPSEKKAKLAEEQV